MKDKMVDIKKGDIISILSYGYDRKYLVNQIVKDLNSKKVIAFNSGSCTQEYFPCKRVEMCYGWDLIKMITEYKNDFSIAIINCLTEGFNSLETNLFIKFLKENKEMKNKTFILIFNAKFETYEKGIQLTYRYFPQYRDSINKYCNKQYSFFRTTKDFSKREWLLENLLIKKTSCYKQIDWKTYELKLVNKKNSS